MHRVLAAILGLSLFAGCSVWGPPPPVVAQFENPALFPIADRDYAYDQVVDVIDDYFRIERLDRVRLIGDTETEGRIETFWQTGATLLEPWHGDSVGGYERSESTLQSIRRRATVRVIPAASGYLVDITVYKELEDLVRPEHSTVGAATFRYDDSLTPYTEPVGGQPYTMGWIPQGRDVGLEQKIVAKLLARAGQKTPKNSNWHVPLPQIIRQDPNYPAPLPPVQQELTVPPADALPPPADTLPPPPNFVPPTPQRPFEFIQPTGGASPLSGPALGQGSP